MYATTETLREQQAENAALLINLWNGIERDVKARGACRINKTLIEAHYRENDLPADFAFLESEAAKLGFSLSRCADGEAYIFRRLFEGFSGITTEELENIYEIYGAKAIVSAEEICPFCSYRCDEHPLLGSIAVEKGSRYLELAALGMCSTKVLFVKTLEI